MQTDPATAEFISQQVREGRYFFLDLDPSPGDELVVACGGCEECGPEYSIERDDFPYYSLEFVYEGRGWVELAGQRSDIRSGSVFTYGPGIPHRIGVDASVVMTKYFVDFVGSSVKTLLHATDLSEPILLGATALEPFRQQFETMIATGQDAAKHARRLCALLLEMLLLQTDEVEASSQSPDAMSWSTYRACRNYIEEHYLVLTSMHEVARACHVSPAHLTRVFKRYHACTPYRFLMQLKMNRAATLLMNPEMLVKEVAAQIGYDDPYHFSKVFKRTLGVSPDIFRRSRVSLPIQHL